MTFQRPPRNVRRTWLLYGPKVALQLKTPQLFMEAQHVTLPPHLPGTSKMAHLPILLWLLLLFLRFSPASSIKLYSWCLSIQTTSNYIFIHERYIHLLVLQKVEYMLCWFKCIVIYMMQYYSSELCSKGFLYMCFLL